MTQIVHASCPGCKNTLRIPADMMSQAVRCRHCQMVFRGRDSEDAAIASLVRRLPLRRPPHELLFAGIAVLVLTGFYLKLARDGTPQPSGLVGHILGIVGFLMMLSTETLYSLRKRWHGFHLGRMSTWLQVHIFTGIVGPYLVLLHSGWKFNGLAGVLMLLTILMVASGFIGRYLYTAVPRTLDGVEVAVRDLEDLIAPLNRQMQALGMPDLATSTTQGGWLAPLTRPWQRLQQRRRLQRAMENGHTASRAEVRRLQQLLAARDSWQRKIDSLALMRRLLALWHVVHVPLGVALFTLAFVHIGAALYYATFLK